MIIFLWSLIFHLLCFGRFFSGRSLFLIAPRFQQLFVIHEKDNFAFGERATLLGISSTIHPRLRPVGLALYSVYVRQQRASRDQYDCRCVRIRRQYGNKALPNPREKCIRSRWLTLEVLPSRSLPILLLLLLLRHRLYALKKSGTRYGCG